MSQTQALGISLMLVGATYKLVTRRPPRISDKNRFAVAMARVAWLPMLILGFTLFLGGSL